MSAMIDCQQYVPVMLCYATDFGMVGVSTSIVSGMAYTWPPLQGGPMPLQWTGATTQVEELTSAESNSEQSQLIANRIGPIVASSDSLGLMWQSSQEGQMPCQWQDITIQAQEFVSVESTSGQCHLLDTHEVAPNSDAELGLNIKAERLNTKMFEEAQGEEEGRRLLQLLQGGREEKWSVIASFLDYTTYSKISSFAAQYLLTHTSASDKVDLVNTLRGHVPRLVKSRFGNFVLQKAVEFLPPIRVKFFAEELLGMAKDTACHVYGCRLICRLLEHLSPDNEATHNLLREILADVNTLLCHTFGSYVIRHVIEHGCLEHQKTIVKALLASERSHGRPRVLICATHGLGSHVVEACLNSRILSWEDKDGIAKVLLADTEHLARVASKSSGQYVVRAMSNHVSQMKADTHRQRAMDTLAHMLVKIDKGERKTRSRDRSLASAL
jgi:hypothetical protein